MYLTEICIPCTSTKIKFNLWLLYLHNEIVQCLFAWSEQYYIVHLCILAERYAENINHCINHCINFWVFFYILLLCHIKMLSFAIVNNDKTLFKTHYCWIMLNRYIDLRSILRYGLATTKVVQPERLIDVKSN